MQDNTHNYFTSNFKILENKKFEEKVESHNENLSQKLQYYHNSDQRSAGHFNFDIDGISQRSTSLESSEHDLGESSDSHSRNSYLSCNLSPSYKHLDHNYILDDLLYHLQNVNSPSLERPQATTNYPFELKLTKESEPTRKQYKTRICTFWLAGKCKRGNSCCWAHGDQDQRNVPDTKKTTICKNWINGLCPHQNDPSQCNFAHGEDDLKKIRGRLFLCGDNERGQCTKGKDCPYAHSIQELSNPPYSPNVACTYNNNNIVSKSLYDQENIIDLIRGIY